jgi:Na+-translocating ferredoxin:NAD+ oxidoreductase RnfG subunit
VSDTVKALIVVPLLALFAGIVVTAIHLQVGGVNSDPYEAAIQVELRRLLPTMASAEPVISDSFPTGRYWRVSQSHATIAYAFVVVTRGFNGPVKSLVLADTNDTLIGMATLNHREHPAVSRRVTAGNISLLRPGLRESPLPDRAGASVSEVTGATTSTQAFTSAVREQLTVDCRKIKIFEHLQKQ